MAVPTENINLEDIRQELGLSFPTSLNACISESGKTGIWNKLSDFAGYSAALNITYDFSNSINIIEDVSLRGYDAHQRVDILPIAGGRGTCSIPVRVRYTIASNEDTFGSARVYYGLTTAPTNVPTWILIGSISGNQLSEDTVNINVGANQYLHLRMDISKKLTSSLLFVSAEFELKNAIAPVCANSVLASGSPLLWSRGIGMAI